MTRNADLHAPQLAGHFHVFIASWRWLGQHGAVVGSLILDGPLDAADYSLIQIFVAAVYDLDIGHIYSSSF
jgi:hypothetical protein